MANPVRMITSPSYCLKSDTTEMGCCKAETSSFTRRTTQRPAFSTTHSIAIPREPAGYLTCERKLAPSSLEIAVCALRFLYKIPLQELVNRPEFSRDRRFSGRASWLTSTFALRASVDNL